jgi:hypothetical protein
MANDIFISYSRRDLEFVERLAFDLNEKVSRVWFDKSDIQVGQQWRDEIRKGIDNCVAMVFVISPDSVASIHVKYEVDLAIELGKVVIPVLYRNVPKKHAYVGLLRETQTLKLQRGSYDENFNRLVYGLIDAGAAPRAGTRPFRQPTVETDWKSVFTKIPGWGAAWSLGCSIPWAGLVCLIAFLTVLQGDSTEGMVAFVLTVSVSTWVGGLIGGVIAGTFTMLALRRYAGSIGWKHMRPSITIWLLGGPLGLVVSIIITGLLAVAGVQFAGNSASADCSGLGFGECLGQGLGIAIGDAIAEAAAIIGVGILMMVVAWLCLGFFYGWLAVRRIRRLEPGIKRAESIWVMSGWSAGTLGGTLTTLVVLVVIASVLG